MKTRNFPLTLAACAALGFLSLSAYAQAEAPVQPAKAEGAKKPKAEGAKKPKAEGAKKPKAEGAKAPKARTISTRVAKATEEATGKPLAPEVEEQLNVAYRARLAAIEAADAKYYADFAAATGLTIDQVREIDRPARTPKKPGEGEGKTKTNPDALTTPKTIEAAPVAPE